MKKIYLLLCFYLLKIDFCGMDEGYNNQDIINDLSKFQGQSVPVKIIRPDYKKPFKDLFKVPEFLFNGRGQYVIAGNEILDSLGGGAYQSFLAAIENKGKIFSSNNSNVYEESLLGGEGNENNKDNNESNNVGCCCFVSSQRFDELRNAYKTSSDENKSLKESGKELVDCYRTYSSDIYNKYKTIWIEDKKKEMNIKAHEGFEKNLKDQIANINKEFRDLLTYDENLKQSFCKYDNDYRIISDYYTRGRNLAAASTNEIKRLQILLQQKGREYLDLEHQYSSFRLQKENEITNLENNKNVLLQQKENEIINLASNKDALLVEKDNQIVNLKKVNTSLQQEKNSVSTSLGHAEAMLQQQTKEIVELKNKIGSLQQNNSALHLENVKLSTQYNEHLQQLTSQSKGLLNLFISNFTQNSSNFSIISRNIEQLNREWITSLNSLNELQNQNVVSFLNSSIESNNKIEENLNSKINDILKEQKTSIDKINNLNNSNLNTILSLFKTTIGKLKQESETILQQIQQQNQDSLNVVNSSNINLNANVAQQANFIMESVNGLTDSISQELQRTQAALTAQKAQMETTNLNISQTTSSISEELNLLKIENEKINNSLNSSFLNLQTNLQDLCKEKQQLLENLKAKDSGIKDLKQQILNLHLNLQQREQENTTLQEKYKNLEDNYSQLQKEIGEIGEVLKINDENKELNAFTTFQTLCIKTKIQELQKKKAEGDVLGHFLQNTNKDLKEKQAELNKQILQLTNEKLDAIKTSFQEKIESLKIQHLGNNQGGTQSENKGGFQNAIGKLNEDLEKSFQESKQVASLRLKNNELEQKVREQEDQLKATASGFDLMEQQEYDNFSNKMRQDHIREILNNTQIGQEMISVSDDKNKNEILKEEYYLPFIFEDYNINDNWVCLNKSGLAQCSKSLYEEKKALVSYGFVCDDKYIFNSFSDVRFNRLDTDYEYERVALNEMIADKNMSANLDVSSSKSYPIFYPYNNKKEFEKYSVFVRGGGKNIVLGREICEKAAHILDNLPGAELYLVFYKVVKENGQIEYFCSYYVKQIPLQQFMEYCAFVQGCSLYSRLYTYGEYLSMFLNNIITGSAAIERSLFRYFTKEDLQSIFATLFSNRWYVGHDIANPACNGDLIPKYVLSYPELLIKPLNKNEYAESKTLDKKIPHPFVDDVIETKEKRYKEKTVFWYKCDMQDPITYCLSECIGLGNYGYIGRFYKRDGQGNYYPVALKVTLDSATHAGGSHEAIMKEIKAGKAAAVMGCNRMIYSNKAGLIKLKNPNFRRAEIEKKDFANIFLNPLLFIKDKNKMLEKQSNLQLGRLSGFQYLLLSKRDCQDFTAMCYRMGEGSAECEMWDDKTKKQTVDYNYRIDFLIDKFKNFYNSENFKKFGNLMFNSANSVENRLLYVMEMDIIEDKDDDLYTDVTEEIKIADNEEPNEDNNSIDIDDNIKNTINNIAEYLTAQQKCGVIHGDIKAKNMTKNKFLDFGSFDMVTNYLFHPEFSDVVGTPEYWDLVRIFNRQLGLLEPYNVLLCDYQLSDLYASFVSLYYYMFKAYPAFATLIIIIKSILKHYVNDKGSNKNFLGNGMSYEKNITDFIANFPLGNELVKCTKAFEKDRKLKKQAKKNNNNNNGLNEEEMKYLLKFNKYLKDVEDKNYLSNEVKQLRYCIFKIIQESLLTVADTKKQDESVDKAKLFFIMSRDTNFYSNDQNGFIEVKAFNDSGVVDKLIEIYKQLRDKELANLEKLINSNDNGNKMLGRIMYQILQQGTFANSDKYPAFDVYINEHSYKGVVDGFEDHRKMDLTYKALFSELKNKIRAKDNEKLEAFLNANGDFSLDYNARLNLHGNSYLYTLEPLSIKSLISQQPYYRYEKSFINTINEEKKNIEQ